MTEAIGRGGMQVPISVKGLPEWGADAQDLVKARAQDEAGQLKVAETPDRLRLLLGRLSKAQNKRLQLVDCVRHKERTDQKGKHTPLLGAALVFTQSRRNQCVLQQFHPLLVAPLDDRQVPESNARTALYREETVRCSYGACHLELLRCILLHAESKEFDGGRTHHCSLVPEALHLAEEVNEPFHNFDGRGGMVCDPLLRCDGRDGMVCAVSCRHVRCGESLEDIGTRSI